MVRRVLLIVGSASWACSRGFDRLRVLPRIARRRRPPSDEAGTGAAGRCARAGAHADGEDDEHVDGNWHESHHDHDRHQIGRGRSGDEQLRQGIGVRERQRATTAGKGLRRRRRLRRRLARPVFRLTERGPAAVELLVLVLTGARVQVNAAHRAEADAVLAAEDLSGSARTSASWADPERSSWSFST